MGQSWYCPRAGSNPSRCSLHNRLLGTISRTPSTGSVVVSNDVDPLVCHASATTTMSTITFPENVSSRGTTLGRIEVVRREWFPLNFSTGMDEN